MRLEGMYKSSPGPESRIVFPVSQHHSITVTVQPQERQSSYRTAILKHPTASCFLKPTGPLSRAHQLVLTVHSSKFNPDPIIVSTGPHCSHGVMCYGLLRVLSLAPRKAYCIFRSTCYLWRYFLNLEHWAQLPISVPRLRPAPS